MSEAFPIPLWQPHDLCREEIRGGHEPELDVRPPIDEKAADWGRILRIVVGSNHSYAEAAAAFIAAYQKHAPFRCEDDPSGVPIWLAPPGYVLLPIEPSEALLDAMHSQPNQVPAGQTILERYRARYDNLLATARAEAVPVDEAAGNEWANANPEANEAIALLVSCAMAAGVRYGAASFVRVPATVQEARESVDAASIALRARLCAQPRKDI